MVWPATELILFGSSWSCGEWRCESANELQVSHGGVAVYLSNHGPVRNHSRPGTSLWQTLHAINNYLEYVLSPAHKNIMVFQHDVARQTMANRFQVDCDDLMRRCQDLEEYHNRVMEIFYIKLHELAARNHLEILLCGSSTDLNLDLVSLYPGLIPVCPSWIALLDPQYRPQALPLVMSAELVELARRNQRQDICEQIFEASEKNFPVLQQLLENQFFENLSARGDFHPNRLGHRVLSDHLLTFFQEQHA